MNHTMKERFFRSILRHRKMVTLIFVLLIALCAWLGRFVQVNSDLTSYLPQDSDSTIALETMQQEFDGEISNCSLMVSGIPLSETTALAQKIAAVTYVTDVSWIGSSLPSSFPLEMLPDSLLSTYYRDGHALYTLTIHEEATSAVLDEIRALTDYETAFSGNFVNTKVAQATSNSEITRVVTIVIIFGLILLMLTLDSFLEPLLLLLCLGIAIILNSGTNIIFGTISAVTRTASSVLQMGVSVDYSIFLLHRYREYTEAGHSNEDAMAEACVSSLTSILSSSLTTVIGFLALLFMRYRIGSDMGLVMSKGIALSLLCTFTILPCIILLLDPLIAKTRHKAVFHSAGPIAAISQKIRIPATLLFLVLLIPAWIMQTNNSYYYGMSRLYKADHTVSLEAEKIEEVFGLSNTMVLMVPKGDTQKEYRLVKELEQEDDLASILSYVSIAGTSVPEEMMPEAVTSLFHSEHYSRIVLKYDANNESEETFALIERIKAAAGRYYGETAMLAGNSASVYDLKTVISADSIKVNLVAVAAIFLVLLLSFRSLLLPVILTLSIEGAIWICMAISYLTGSHLFYIGYLIVSSILLGSTVDYAILITARFRETLPELGASAALKKSITLSAISIFTSGLILSMAGFLLSLFCVNQLIAQLGILLCRGTLLAMVVVLSVLPGLLYLTAGKHRHPTD